MRPTAVARFPCSGIVPLPAALGEYGGGTLMGGLPHMVPHSAVLRPTSDSSGSQLGRAQLTFSVPFHSNNLELREEAGTTYRGQISSSERCCRAAGSPPRPTPRADADSSPPKRDAVKFSRVCTSIRQIMVLRDWNFYLFHPLTPACLPARSPQ